MWIACNWSIMNKYFSHSENASMNPSTLAVIAYELGGIATFIKLTFFDGYVYNAWNWLIAVPVNLFLSQIWPLYWLILKPLAG